MHKIANGIKSMKKLLLCVCILAITFSVTTFAAEFDNGWQEVETAEYNVILDASEYVYTGTEIKPDVVVAKVNEAGTIIEGTALTEGTDYTVAYSNNVNVGTASAVVTGTGAFTDNLSLSAEYVITPASIEDAEIVLSKTSYVYNGNEKKPSVKVLLNGVTIDASNYTVSYSDNVEIGTAYAEVTGTGNLTGSVKVSYEIKLKKPSFSLARSYDRVRVYWSKVADADGYEIYRSTSKDSGFKKIATVTAGKERKVTDKGLTHNKKYYYKVRSYCKVNGEKSYSDYTEVKSITVRVGTPTIKEIKKTNSTTLTIRWTDIDGASGYRIYRATSENGEYKTIATVSGKNTVTYKDTGRVCGRTYYYKVKAYRTVDGKKYFGSASEIKKGASRPVKVKISSDTSYDATTITLRWKKAAGAEGYQIWRATSKNGEYKKVKTIKSADTLKWKDKELTKGKTYYYKVRAYCETDGKTTYGMYSDAYAKRKAGWRYSTYDGKKVKLYYNAKNQLVKDVSNLIGKQKSYVIKVNKKRCTVTVYAKDGDNGYIIPVKAFICSPGYSTPTGTFYTPAKYRWHELMGPCWGQWCTRIRGGILFHSVFYNSYHNADSLSVSAYNKLGTICSHGCVRVTAGDGKWIYDNCKLNTKVIIYNSSKAGPLGKPKAAKLPYWHTWDPTDPNKFAKCDARGCH